MGARTVAIKCIKIEMKIHHKKHKRDGIGLIQKPRGHKEDGPPFPIKSDTKSHKSITNPTLKRRIGERDTGAAAWRIEESMNRLQKPLLT